MKKLSLFIYIISIFLIPVLQAQSAPINPTPDMIQQAQSLSSSQQRDLAKQIGIEIPDNGEGDIQTSLEDQTNNRFEEYIDEDEINVGSTNIGLNSRFGMSIFQNRVTTFSPIDNLPVPDDYKLGAGDTLIIKLIGTENIQLSSTISRDGSIFINQIGDIVLAGLMFDEAVSLIKQRIESALIGVQVFVTMGRIKTINVFISGEVNKPGMYSLSSLTTVTQSLYQAGGITNIGSLRKIQVIRNGNVINQFDAYDLLVYGNSKNDIRLRSGDVLFVPTYEGIVSIGGNVKRRNVFEIKKSDTYGDLLRWAGGYSPNANPEFGFLITSDGIGSLSSAKTIDFRDPKNLDLELKPNDKYTIPATGDSIFNSITILGAVNRQGQMGWFPGMRISDILRDINEDLNPDEVDFDFSFIERFNPSTFLWEIIPFNLLDSIIDKSGKSNLLVFDNDVVQVLYNDSRRTQQINSAVNKLKNQSSSNQLSKVVAITGAVKFPGEYPIFEDGNLSDIFVAAGGFKDDALLGSIEISRSDLIEDGLVVPRIFEISALDNLNESINFKLQSRDRVHVRTVEELNTDDSITLRGQVKYPGSYPLNKGDTLKSVIMRAGGLLDNAFTSGAILQRQVTAASQRNGNAKLAQTIRSSYASSLLTSEDVNNSFSEINAIAELIENSPNNGRVIIDLDAALIGDKDSNISLTADDVLSIPKVIDTISVIGEVNSSNSNLYDSNLNVEDYIALAGGFTPRANKSDIYIIKPNGAVAPLTKSFYGFGLTRYKLQQGDTIVVPVKADYHDNLKLWSQVTQIFYQSLVSLAALNNITD